MNGKGSSGETLLGGRERFPFQSSANGGQRLAGSLFSRADHVGRLREIIPQKWSDVWLDDDVGMAAPFDVGVLLDDGEGTAEHVGEGARFFDRAGFEMDGDDQLGSKEQGAFDWNKGREKTINEHTAFEFDGNKQAGISARSAQRRTDGAAAIIDRQAHVDIGGGDGERGVQVFEEFCGREAREKNFETIVGGETEPGGGPPAEVGELGFRGDPLHVVESGAGAIGCTDQSAHTGAGNDVNGNAFLAQNAEDANVSDTASESAGKCEADARTFPCGLRCAVGSRRVLVILPGHTPSILGCAGATKRAFDREGAIL